MREFCKETDGICRLRVPIENIYTSVFLIDDAILVDCASTAEDVEAYIVPALHKRGLALTNIKAIVITHAHSDHKGGLERVVSLAPDIEIVTDVKELGNGISTYPMAGHSDDSIGVLDERTRTLISADGLQGAGVDKYRCYTQNPAAYVQTLERVRNDSRIETVLFSHAYEPWNEDRVCGRDNVICCIDECYNYVNTELKGK